MKSLQNVTLLTVDCIDLPRVQLAADICEKDFSFGAVKLLSSIPSRDPRIVPIRPIKSKKQYSEFCIKEMTECVATDFVLIFQYDGFILNPSAWTDEFLQYDYIGAPWYHEGALHVGNGGFSLRSKRLLDFIKDHYRKIGGSLHPEDVWISRDARPWLEKAGMKFAPEDVASRFSKEGNTRSVVWNGEFGFHGITYTDISRWLNAHPEYKDRLTYEQDDFTRLFRKYPIHDGTVHVFRCQKIHMSHYKKLAAGKKNYDVRMEDDLHEADWGNAEPGHMVVYKRSGVSLEEVSVPAFERKIVKIERFSSKSELLKKYPDISITPSLRLSVWNQRMAKIFGNVVYPEHKSYTALWF